MSIASAASAKSLAIHVARHPLTWVIVVAVAIRIIVVAGVSVSLGYADTVRYVGQGSGDNLDADGVAPPGYGLFLRLVHAVTASVDGVLIMQQLLVVLAGVCVYATTRRLGTRTGVATGAAAVMMLCGNLLSTSQAILTESLFASLTAVVALLVVRQVTAPAWSNAVLLGAAMGAAIAVRSVALPVALLILVLMALVGDRTRRGALAALAALGASVAAVAVVALAMGTTAGVPLVGKSSEGWVLYGRVAQFADCKVIDPPRSLRSLCVTDPGQRPGPDYYRFVGGPAVDRFGGLPRGDDQLSEFATRAILAQPLDYAKAVAIDTGRFFAPNLGTERAYNGPGWEEIEIDRPLDPSTAAYTKERIEDWFDSFGPRTSTLGFAARYQEATTITGGHLLVFVLLAIAGLIWGGGRPRRAAWLLVAGGFGFLVAAAGLNVYIARYSLPSFGFLLPAAGYGLTMIARVVAQPSEPPGDAA